MSILDETRNRAIAKSVPERQDVLQEQPSPSSQEENTQSDRSHSDFDQVSEPSPISDLERLRAKLAECPEIAK